MQIPRNFAYKISIFDDIFLFLTFFFAVWPTNSMENDQNKKKKQKKNVVSEKFSGVTQP